MVLFTRTSFQINHISLVCWCIPPSFHLPYTHTPPCQAQRYIFFQVFQAGFRIHFEIHAVALLELLLLSCIMHATNSLGLLLLHQLLLAFSKFIQWMVFSSWQLAQAWGSSLGHVLLMNWNTCRGYEKSTCLSVMWLAFFLCLPFDYLLSSLEAEISSRSLVRDRELGTGEREIYSWYKNRTCI